MIFISKNITGNAILTNNANSSGFIGAERLREIKYRR